MQAYHDFIGMTVTVPMVSVPVVAQLACRLVIPITYFAFLIDHDGSYVSPDWDPDKWER